jgi:hypothetical protein
MAKKRPGDAPDVRTTIEAAAKLADAIGFFDTSCHSLNDDGLQEYLSAAGLGKHRARASTAIANSTAALARELWIFEGVVYDSELDLLDSVNTVPAALSGEEAGCYVEVVWKIAQQRLRIAQAMLHGWDDSGTDWNDPESLLATEASECVRGHAEKIAAVVCQFDRLSSEAARLRLAKEADRAICQTSSITPEDLWLTVTEAAREQAVDRYTITRAADAGLIRTNGQSGRGRRIDAVSLVRWSLSRVGD